MLEKRTGIELSASFDLWGQISDTDQSALEQNLKETLAKFFEGRLVGCGGPVERDIAVFLDYYELE